MFKTSKQHTSQMKLLTCLATWLLFVYGSIVAIYGGTINDRECEIKVNENMSRNREMIKNKPSFIFDKYSKGIGIEKEVLVCLKKDTSLISKYYVVSFYNEIVQNNNSSNIIIVAIDNIIILSDMCKKEIEVAPIIERGATHELIDVQIGTAEKLFNAGHKDAARQILINIITMQADELMAKFNNRQLPYGIPEEYQSEKVKNDPVYKQDLDNRVAHWRLKPIFRVLETLSEYNDTLTKELVKNAIQKNTFISDAIKKYKAKKIEIEIDKEKRTKTINKIENYLRDTKGN